MSVCLVRVYVMQLHQFVYMTIILGRIGICHKVTQTIQSTDTFEVLVISSGPDGGGQSLPLYLPPRARNLRYTQSRSGGPQSDEKDFCSRRETKIRKLSIINNTSIT
jgi:hypothetical protein